MDKADELVNNESDFSSSTEEEVCQPFGELYIFLVLTF